MKKQPCWLLLPFSRLSETFKYRPRILNHVFPAVHAYRIRVSFFVFIGVAFDFIDIDRIAVMAFHENVFATDVFEGLLDIGDEIPKIRLMVFFPKDGI